MDKLHVDTIQCSDGLSRPALDGMTKITTQFGKPARVAVYQAGYATPFGDRVLTTVWLFPYVADNCIDEPIPGQKMVYVGSTIHNPADPFSYKQAFINALTDAGRNYVVKNIATKHVEGMLAQYKWDGERVDKAIARWARHVGRTLFSERGAWGDIDNSPELAATIDEIKAAEQRLGLTESE